MDVFLRFADIFGARAALSLSCLASVIYFMLLAAADSPLLLFLHKLPAVFMHALPGQINFYKYILLIIYKQHCTFLDIVSITQWHNYTSFCFSAQDHRWLSQTCLRATSEQMLCQNLVSALGLAWSWGHLWKAPWAHALGIDVQIIHTKIHLPSLFIGTTVYLLRLVESFRQC